jgi:hypothetical protein
VETQQTETLEQVIMHESSAYWSNIAQYEAKAIAAAVREWMQEQNEGLRKDIYQIIDAIDWEATSTSIVTDKILSVIPPRRVQSAPDRERIKELEAEVARLKEPQSTYERQIASDEKYAKAIQEEWDALRAKVAKYDELRAKFPFLPGDVFYAMATNNGKLYKDTVDRLHVDGKIDGQKIVNVRPEAAYHTADACRAAIPVEE